VYLTCGFYNVGYLNFIYIQFAGDGTSVHHVLGPRHTRRVSTLARVHSNMSQEHKDESTAAPTAEQEKKLAQCSDKLEKVIHSGAFGLNSMETICALHIHKHVMMMMTFSSIDSALSAIQQLEQKTSKQVKLRIKTWNKFTACGQAGVMIHGTKNIAACINGMAQLPGSENTVKLAKFVLEQKCGVVFMFTIAFNDEDSRILSFGNSFPEKPDQESKEGIESEIKKLSRPDLQAMKDLIKRAEGKRQHPDLQNKCLACGGKPEKTCTRCKLALYCNAECQQKHWTEHKRICQLAKAFIDQAQRTDPQLQVKVHVS